MHRAILACLGVVLAVLACTPSAFAAKPEAEPKPGEEFQDCDTCPKMVVLPAGRFTMGSPPGEKDRDDDEGPQRSVAIPSAFAVGKFEVTRDQFDAFVNDSGHDVGSKCQTHENEILKERTGRSFRNPGFKQGGNEPAVCLNWNNAKSYVAWLSKKTGKTYRLLSEAEWEYAARAGTTTPFSTGRTITTDQANFDGNDTYNGSRKGQYREKTVSVGSFPANAFGLHDMHGNVWEWVEDCYHDSYNGAPSDGSAWIARNCSRRVLRGGSWSGSPWFLPSAFRGWDFTIFRLSDFRFSRGEHPSPEPTKWPLVTHLPSTHPRAMAFQHH